MAESEILTRLAVGFVLVALTVFAVILGGVFLLVLTQIAISLGAWEVLRMRGIGGFQNQFVSIVGAVSVGLGFFLGTPMLFLVITLLAVMGIQLVDHRRATVDSMTVTLLAVVYPSLLISHVLLLRNLSIAHTCFPLVCVWTYDTAAYLTGRALGRTRIAPAVSPGKSLEGMAGGLVCTIFVAVLAKATFVDFLSFPAAILLAVVVAIVGQGGDLFESWIKRAAAVKDSSGALPGHGGVLDRIDSLAFAIPVAYYLLLWISPA